MICPWDAVTSVELLLLTITEDVTSVYMKSALVVVIGKEGKEGKERNVKSFDVQRNTRKFWNYRACYLMVMFQT